MITAGLAFGPARYTGKAGDRAMAVYMIPVMIGLVAVLGHVTVLRPALRRRNRRGEPGDR